MNKKEREEYISKIQKFVDSGEEIEGKIRFSTMDAITATYSMALLILDMYDRTNKEDLNYDSRTRKFAERGKP